MSYQHFLAPKKALLAPLWLTALAVLIVNDHLLKGSGLLPGLITGKLSDFAGMLVAPTLLAVLLRVRQRRDFALCHYLIGFVFAAINLWPQVAHGWSAFMGLFGFPWQIVCDTSDLIALPVLLLSWKVFVPIMEEPQAITASRFHFHPIATTMGLWASIATSPPPLDFTPIYADVYVHNGNDNEDLIVRLRTPDPEIQLDCNAIAQNPGALLSPAIFGPANTWTLPPRSNAAVRDMNLEQECYAVLLESDILPPLVLFWQRDQIIASSIEGQIWERSEHGPGAVLLNWSSESEEEANYENFDKEVAFPLSPTTSADLSPACILPQDHQRLAWSDFRAGLFQIAKLELGIDGCMVLDLEDAEQSGGQSGYLCVPQDSFPFSEGDWLRVEHNFTTTGTQTLRLLLQDSQGNAAENQLAWMASIGGQLPTLPKTELSFVRNPSCDALLDECGTAAYAGALQLAFDLGTELALMSGESVLLEGEDDMLEVHLAYAASRAVLNADCSLGSDVLGADIEVLTIYQKNL